MDYTDVQKKQGELIKSVRIQLGLSGEELGNKLGVSKAITNLKKTLDSINDINPLSLKNQYKNSKTADREFFIKQLPHMMTNKELSIFLISLSERFK